MLQSYEGLDRAGGLARGGLLAPLRHRDFRLLLGGLTVSLLGDGVFLVALAWQVYTISDAPSALGAVGIAMTIPTITCLLLGGALSDRVDRRSLMLCADLVRAATMGVLAGSSIAGVLTLPELLVLAVVYGVATAFFDPSSDAVVPELLPAELLPAANSLDQLVRPLALRLTGPALGGFAVAAVGNGCAFALDAGSFVVSAATLAAIRPRGRCAPAERADPTGPAGPGIAADTLAGLRYVRSQPWLWATLATAAVAYLLFMGPTEVLLPYVVKHRLHGGAGALGVVFAAGGLGSLLCAIAIGQRGLPRRPILWMYVCWTVGTLAVAGYGVARHEWGLMIASVAFNTLETAGTIFWISAKQHHVPAGMLGRVSSLDWLISIGLLPISFGLTGPVSAAIGITPVLVGAGVLGGLVTLAGVFVPGVLGVDPRPHEPAEAVESARLDAPLTDAG